MGIDETMKLGYRARFARHNRAAVLYRFLLIALPVAAVRRPPPISTTAAAAGRSGSLKRIENAATQRERIG